MVKKKPGFVQRPAIPPAAADDWVKQGGTDPEIQKEPEPVQEAIATPPTEDNGKGKYPHRISFDMATPQYKRLKRASFEEETPMNEILRDAVEAWLKARDY